MLPSLLGIASLLFIVWDVMKHSFQVRGAAPDERTTH
jgi:hypothetical protein